MHITYRDKEWTFDKRTTVQQVLNRMKLLPESVLVLRNGNLVPEDERLEVGDEVKVVAVISGG